MADIDGATSEAREALLKKIAELTPQFSSTGPIKDLAEAFALTVGAMPGRLPGALGEVKVSK